MRTLLALLTMMALAGSAAAAPDCDGGRLIKVEIRPRVARLAFTVTRQGLTHATLVGPQGLTVSIVAPNPPPVEAYGFTIPAERFVTEGNVTRYDGAGDFAGAVTMRKDRGQADTVRVLVKGPGGTIPEGAHGFNLRAIVTSGPACARTCVGRCKVGSRGSCSSSIRYEPFAELGFGTFKKRSRKIRSGYCGLAIDPDPGCDFLIEERCLLPYPSSHFLTADASTPTGLRVSYPTDGLPQNVGGTHIDPTDWNALDGFSPGTPILALFPDGGQAVDLAASNVAFHTDFARSLEADHPTVLLDMTTGERVLHFAELDANAPDPAHQALIIRPGRRLDDGRRYAVAIRNLIDAAGAPIRPRLAFRAVRDATFVGNACGSNCLAPIRERAEAMAPVLAALETAGVDPANLVLAWDFTTASTAALTNRIRSVRDQAFALPTPTFTVDSVDDGPGGLGFNPHIYRRIQGTFQAPLYMTADAPGARLNLVDGVPQQNGFATVPYVVDIPHVAANIVGEPVPARATTWGHGLLGDRFQLGALEELASGFNFVIAAVDMQGMSSADVPAIIPVINDFSLFHRIPDRLHQGFLHHLLLGRLLADPGDGFNGDAAFRFGIASTGVIDTSQVFYSGGSQGGIFGVAIMAIATNFTRGFLAVPGSNYSTLLNRSIDFNPFLALFRVAYPDFLDQQIVLALAQQQWDRAEPHGYLPHLTSGTLADPPVPHKVLLHMATHDSEVSNLATEIMVRSLDIPQVTPAHRSFVGIAEMAAPFDGSAFVEIDPQRGFSRCDVPAGDDPGATCTTDADCPGPGDPAERTACHTGIPPLTNTPPLFNNGAHGSTGVLTAGQQIDAFLRTNGTVQQFCAGTCDPE